MSTSGSRGARVSLQCVQVCVEGQRNKVMQFSVNIQALCGFLTTEHKLAATCQTSCLFGAQCCSIAAAAKACHCHDTWSDVATSPANILHPASTCQALYGCSTTCLFSHTIKQSHSSEATIRNVCCMETVDLAGPEAVSGRSRGWLPRDLLLAVRGGAAAAAGQCTSTGMLS